MTGSWHSKHFIRGEFSCKCRCGFNTIDYGLVCTLDDIHDELHRILERKIRITVTSGCRCESHNRVVGKPSSFHLSGMAADIKAEKQMENGEWIEVPPVLVQDIADQFNPGGLGRYKTFTHIDTREGRSRWPLT